MKLRVGIVGLGEAWETRHRLALRSLADRYEVRAVCAEVAHLAERAAQEFGALSVDGYRALAARSDVDVVLLLSPDWYGPLPILAACESGKAVYSATALDLDPIRALEIKQRVDKSGVAFMAEFPRRHAPATVRLKELIATRLGQPRLLFCHARRKFNKSANGSRKGVKVDTERDLVELVDWCRYVVGVEPTSVFGVQHQNAVANNHDYQMMSLDFSPQGMLGSGPIAQISCGQYLTPTWPEAISFRPPSELQVCCERGVAFIDLPATLVWFDEAGRQLESLESERPVGEQMLTQFHRAVTSLVRKSSDLEDAYRASSIVLSARQSAIEGRRVWLTP